MRQMVITILAAGLFSLSCTPVQATYPSYERAKATYAQPEPGEVAGVRGKSSQCNDAECDCPRFWYDNHWVYHCDDYYYYWYHDDWYYYPPTHRTYFEGPRYYPSHGERRVTKE